MEEEARYTRREFIKTSAVGLAMAGLPTLTPSSLLLSSKTNEPIGYRTLGRTGLKVSVVSFGVMRADNPGLIAEAIRMGINHFDTANAYQNGNNEKMVGEVVKREGGRDKLIIATKVLLPRDKKVGRFTSEATKDSFIKMCDEGLRRLQMEYVDILYVHSIISPKMVFYEPALEALARLKKEGKTRFIGISVHEREEEIIQEALKRDFYDVILTAYNFKKENREAIKKSITSAHQKGIGIIAMKTQVGGFDGSPQGLHPFQACLKWVLDDTHVACAIPGITNVQQLEENCAVMRQLELSQQEVEQLSAYSKFLDGRYCHGCKECVGRCPQQLDIPEYMRSYMYLVGYKDHDRALGVVREVARYSPATVCESCELCSTWCSHGIDVKGRISQLRRLLTFS
jgi:aryl-alcohol dehydrogenase-like predicted oxidoreductase